jgi:GntR family transcriptional regulator
MSRSDPEIRIPPDGAFSISKEADGPAYVQLANHLRAQIANGTYRPGGQLPTETALSAAYRISGMTVRQAIGQLSSEGLVKRVHGRGTFVNSMEWQGSGFSLKPLEALISERASTRVKVLRARVAKAEPGLADKLSVPPLTKLINIVRLLIQGGRPTLLQKGYLIYDPTLPILEAELDVISLAGLFTGAPNDTIKKGSLEALPVNLGEEEARLLEMPAGSPAFAIEYLFWDFDDRPVGNGFFLVPQPSMTLKARIGLWLEPPGD